eukprot:1178286-Prorocentrum_minimum.AAC.1
MTRLSDSRTCHLRRSASNCGLILMVPTSRLAILRRKAGNNINHFINYILYAPTLPSHPTQSRSAALPHQPPARKGRAHFPASSHTGNPATSASTTPPLCVFMCIRVCVCVCVCVCACEPVWPLWAVGALLGLRALSAHTTGTVPERTPPPRFEGATEPRPGRNRPPP